MHRKRMSAIVSAAILCVLIGAGWLAVASKTPGGGIEQRISLEGQRAVFFGDSVAYGFSTEGRGFGYYLQQQYGLAQQTNAARNTATFNTLTQGENNIIRQILQHQGEEYDYVILQGGYGDLRDLPPLGQLTPGKDRQAMDTGSFAGAVEYALSLAAEQWPDARIGFIISYDTPQDTKGIRGNHEACAEYWAMARAACGKWGVPYLDLFEGSALFEGREVAYSQLLEVEKGTYFSDTVHLSEQGYQRLCPFLAEWMQSLPQREEREK